MRSDKSRRIAIDAMFAALALMLTFVESVLPIASFVPIPGFRLGLANVAVMIALVYSGKIDSFGVALVKIFVSSMLFSNPMSFLFSLSGTLFSYIGLVILYSMPKKFFGFVGLSVISALLHNLGQLFVAFVFFGEAAFAFISYLLFASLISGIFTGILICSVSPILNRIL